MEDHYLVVDFNSGAAHTLRKTEEKGFEDYVTELLNFYSGMDKIRVQHVSPAVKNNSKQYLNQDFIRLDGNFIISFPKSEVEETIDRHVSSSYKETIRNQLENKVTENGRILAADALTTMFSLPLKELKN